MDIRVLGPIEVHNGHKLAIGGPRQRRILAALALHVGEVVSLDRLVDITWSGEEVPDQPETNVRTYIYRVRSGLGEGLGDRIETGPHGYVLRAEPDELDVARFECLVERADRVADQGDASSALAYAGEALSLWRGHPYQEFDGEPWVAAECSRLTDLRARVLERRCDALLQLGRAEEATIALEGLIAEYPYRERPRRLHMLALYNSGRQAEAIRAFQEFRAMLIEEAGIDPSDELSDLERQILDQDPALRVEAGRPRSLRSYELDDVIGEGAFALVWRGTQPILGREVAVKQVRSTLANDPDFIRRFEVEAQLVASLEHPYIVPLYDYWREPDAAFLVMRLLRGGTLEDRMAKRPLDDAELRRLVEHVGSALGTAHRSGVIHRDVKPANVLLDDEGNFYLTDFGIAFGIEGEDDAAAALSTGSPPYASPEQLKRQHLDPRSDIYAFGVTLYAAAVGRAPFGEETTRAGILRRQLEDEFPPPSHDGDEVPPWLDDVVRQATAKLPGDRFTSVDDLMAAVWDSGDRRLPALSLAGTVGAAGPVGPVRNPFKGLQAFREADVADFHGRTRLMARLLDVLRLPGSGGRLLAAVGPSGSGKSSAVRAGLIPALRKGAIAGSENWFITTMMPGSFPFEELESALARIAVAPPGPLAGPMATDARGITRAIEQILPDDSSELLLVIDQFEELFTMAAGEDQTGRFLDGLLTAIRTPRSRLRVAVTIRADFWDRPLKHPGLAPLLEDSAVTVSPLSADELEQAIVAPVADRGVEYEPGLVARISADVLDQAGALPLLQYTLTELFDRNVSGVILASAYDELGGIAGALSMRAEELYSGMDEPERASLRRLLGRLVSLGEGTEDTRRRVTMSELGHDAVTSRVISQLGETRLVTFDCDPATREPTVEIAHEALLRGWPRLRGWIDEDRDTLRVHRHLTSAATDWDRGGRDDDELYRGTRLEGAQALRELDASSLNELESAFVAASAARAASDEVSRRRRTRVLQGALVATAVLAVVAVVAGLLASDRARDAERTRDDLTAELLAASIVDTAEVDPALGALLAAELYDLDPNVRSLNLVANALLAKPDWIGAIPGYWIETSPYGPWVLTLESSQIVLRDPDDLAPIRAIAIDSLEGQQPGPRWFPAISPDGRYVVIDQPDGPRIVDLETGAFGGSLDLEVNGVGQPATWSHDGRHLLIAADRGSVAVFGVDGVETTFLFEQVLDEDVIAPALDSHPSQPLAAVSSAGLLLVLDTAGIEAGAMPLVERFVLNEETIAQSIITWGDDGTLYAPVFGTPGFAYNDGDLRALDSLPESGRRVVIEPLSDGNLVVSDNLGEAAVVDPGTGDIVDGPWSPGSGSLFNPVEVAGGDVLALRSNVDASIQLFSRVGGNPLGRTLPAVPVLDGAFYLPDGEVVQQPGSSVVHTLASGQAEPIDFGVDDIASVRLSPTTDGSRAVVVDQSGNLTVHDLPSGIRVAGPIEIGDSEVFGELSADGRLVVVGAATTMRVFDVESGDELLSVDHGGERSNWGPRVRRGMATMTGTAASGARPSMVVVDLETLEVIFREESELAYGSDFTTDGSGIVKPTEEGALSVVNMTTGEVEWAAPDTALGGFDPSGEYVISEFFGVQFYDYATGEAVSPFVDGRSWLHREAGVLTQVREGRVHVWNIDPSSWPEVACEAAGRNLTRAEWEAHIPGDRPYEPSCEQWPIDE